MSEPPSSNSSSSINYTSRRGALRAVGLHIAATYRLPGVKAPVRGSVLDLSATGALLQTPQPLAQGDVIQLEFSVPKGPRIRCQATVVRCKTLADGAPAAGLALTVSVEEELDLAQWVFDRV